MTKKLLDKAITFFPIKSLDKLLQGAANKLTIEYKHDQCEGALILSQFLFPSALNSCNKKVYEC